MNIFLLSLNVIFNAMYATDSHIIKMILEYVQLLCTAHRILDGDKISDEKLLYKKTHINHPCAKWTRTTSSNYDFLYRLYRAYCREYAYRFNKRHKCDLLFRESLKEAPQNIPKGPLTRFALAMPDKYKSEDPVESYRNYYIHEKSHLFKWKNRSTPFFLCK